MIGEHQSSSEHVCNQPHDRAVNTSVERSHVTVGRLTPCRVTLPRFSLSKEELLPVRATRHRRRAVTKRGRTVSTSIVDSRFGASVNDNGETPARGTIGADTILRDRLTTCRLSSIWHVVALPASYDREPSRRQSAGAFSGTASSTSTIGVTISAERMPMMALTCSGTTSNVPRSCCVTIPAF